MNKVLVFLLAYSWTVTQPPLLLCARPPVRVTVFYEAMHEDSRAFIVDQLKPAFDALAPEFMQIDLVPYGKARDVRSNPARTPITHTFFNAQYQAQYEANKLHACVLLFLQREYPRDSVAVVSCALAYPEGAVSAYGACFTDLSPMVQSKINACAVESYGDRLLSHNGRVTHARQPPIRLYPDAGKIPRIEIDGEYNVFDEMMASTNLKRVVCRKFRGPTKRRCKRMPTPPKVVYPESSTSPPLPDDAF